MMKQSFFILLGIILLAFSCSKKQNNSSIDLGLTYYPTEIGKFCIYEVDSTIYTDLTKDTIHYKYLIKEKIAGSFTDNLGLSALRLERYIKKYTKDISYDSIPWTIKEVWAVNSDESTIQVVESNQRFTKLIFPIMAKSTWNGNAFNANGEEIYVYEYIDQTEKIGTETLVNVLEVKQKESRSLISLQYKVEKYAKGIGLVYREITDIASNTIVSGKPVEDRIEQGMIYKQTLLSHGYE